MCTSHVLHMETGTAPFALTIRVNTYHTACVSRRQVKNSHIFSQNVKILKFGNNIWYHHVKCIQISTNMPSIESVLSEIGFEFEEF